MSITRDEAKKWLPIISAYAEGKTIQTQHGKDDHGNIRWQDLGFIPHFDGPIDYYRIKPEPREFWLRKRAENELYAVWHSFPAGVGVSHEIIHVREVL